jgi:hypothetical protein
MKSIYICNEPQCRQQCVFSESCLTCTTCGLEQDIPIFKDEINVFDRACYFPEVTEDARVKANQTRNNMFFNIIQDSCKIPDSVMQLALDMFSHYINHTKKSINREFKRLEFCCACVYYASRSINTGVLTQDFIIQKVFHERNNLHNIKLNSGDNINAPSIQWACKELIQSIPNSPYSHLFVIENRCQTSCLPRMIKKVTTNLLMWDPCMQQYKDLFKLCHKLYDIAQKNDKELIENTHPEKFATSLIFIGLKILKKRIGLSNLARLTDTSEPLILKIEKKMLSWLKK